MTSDEFKILLYDRIEMIKLINSKYDLENNAYISFSGGKDSTILHYLIDLALPNNKIPRVFINTGIEYLDIVRFVKDLASKDDRFVILNPTTQVISMLEKYGYPFKSKLHAHNLAIYQNSGITKTNEKYLNNDRIISCPKILKYQFTDSFNIKVSDKCCYKLKKEPCLKWQKENNKTILLTGMKKEEGGNRKLIKCIVTKNNELKKFHPILVVNDEWQDLFIKEYNIRLCNLYYPPYNFKRTGCKGCPFSLNLQEDLDVMERLLPIEKKQCEIIWQPIYEEYRRIGYRLRKKDEPYQMKLFI